MRKFTLLLSAAAAIAACAVVFGVGVASADPGNGNGAVVQHNAYGASTCFVNNADFSQIWVIDGCTFNIVTTPSGVVNETVKGTVDSTFGSAPPASAFKGSTATTGEFCDFGSGAANIVTETITPSGNFSAKCSSSS